MKTLDGDMSGVAVSSLFVVFFLCFLVPSINAAAFTSSPGTFTVSNIVMDVGQISVANAVVTGGSGGPYSGEWTWISSNPANQLNDFKIVNTITGGSEPWYI